MLALCRDAVGVLCSPSRLCYFLIYEIKQSSDRLNFVLPQVLSATIQWQIYERVVSSFHPTSPSLSLCLSLSLSIYIYICIFRQHFFVNANFIKHNRYFMSTYFLLDPFEFLYYFYRIRGELIKVLSIVVCIPSTVCTILGHHQRRNYYKSDVTFVLAYYYCVRASLPLKIIAFAFKCNSIIRASS